MDYLVSVSWVDVVFSAGAGMIYYCVGRTFLKQSPQGAAPASLLLLAAALIFKWLHGLLAERFLQPWPYDLRDEHTAFLLAAPLLSGGIALLFARCSLRRLVGFGFLSAALNAFFCLLVGLIAFFFH